MTCKRGRRFSKVLGLHRSLMSIGPPINPKYSVGLSPSDVPVIKNLSFQSLCEMGKIGKYRLLANIEKSQFSIFFMN